MNMNARECYTSLAKDYLVPMLAEQGWKKGHGYHWEKIDAANTVEAQVDLRKYYNDTEVAVALILEVKIYDIKQKARWAQETEQKLASGEPVYTWCGNVSFACLGEVHAQEALDALAGKVRDCINDTAEPYLTGKLAVPAATQNNNLQHYPALLSVGTPRIFTEWK